MRRWAFILFLLMTANSAMGQAAFESERIRHGGFIGPVFKISTINDDGAQLLGFRGGWILNFEGRHSLVLGAGVYGVLNDINARGVTLGGEPVSLGMDYAGLELAYRHRTFRLVHFSARTLIGAGGVDYRNVGDAFQDEENEENGAGFFVVEPGVSITFNVLPFARLSSGVSYRYVNGVHLSGTTDKDLSDVSWAVSLQLGRF